MGGASGQGKAVGMRLHRPEDRGQGGEQRVGAACLGQFDAAGRAAERYPANPNGSPGGATAFTIPDGRVTILMPHPERVHRSAQMSWAPRGFGEASPWLRMFRNARVWVD